MDYKDILIKIRRIVRSINLESKKVQKDFGVSIPQIFVTGIIGRLEKKGFLARLPKSGDKRVMHIALTSSGDALLERTPDLLQQRLDEKLKGLSADELVRVGGALDLLIEMLEIEASQADEMPLITGDFESDTTPE
jgi:DNA-binding MarR family transcriptional regulator